MVNTDEKYMRKCFSLAKKGFGKTFPNPMVGCVVLDKNGNIISTGFHKKYGENHAEREALLKIQKKQAYGGTLYVNLEPCSHYGKTPPCVDLIVEYGIKRVVIGMKDVNPLVKGIEKLEAVGIEVVTGMLEEEAKFLNRVFIKNMKYKMPYVVLKTASTMDGKISTSTGDSKWITSKKSREEVYKMRKIFDCIMTTSNTVIADDPIMEHKFKCILDRDMRTKKDAQIYKQGEIYTATRENTPTKDGKLDIKSVLRTLYKMGKYTVFVECGGTLAGYMLKHGLIDEVYQFIGAKILNDNSGKSCFDGDNIKEISHTKNLNIYEVKQIENNILIKSIIE